MIKDKSKNKKTLKSNSSIFNDYSIKNNIGVEDPNGININPLNNQPYSTKYVELSKIWTEKIVYKNRQKLYDVFPNSQIILFVSGTSTGKTILAPRLALHALNYKHKVLVCTPKRLPTFTNAKFVADCMDVKLGEEVGYYYQGTNEINKNNVESKLIFATTGSVLSQLTGSNPLLSEYKCIIVDEAHERQISTDVLLLLLKRVCEQRKDFQVVIMSATISLQTFRDYFPKSQFRFSEVDMGSEISFPVQEKWLNQKSDDWKKTAVDITMNILKMTSTGDIMIFVKSAADANQLCIQLDKALSDFRKKLQLENKSKISTKKNNTYSKSKTKKTTAIKSISNIPKEYQINPLCCKLEGSSNSLDQKIATDANYYKTMKDSKGYPYTRKIVCTTPVAESSITVNGIVFIINSGLEYTDSYDPNGRIRALLESPISKASQVQRRGRAGRTQAGYCFHLYTKREQDAFQEYPTPSIEKSDITNDILDLMRLPQANTVKTVRELLDEFISPPHEKFILNSLRTLHALGAITNIQDDGTITPLGYALTRFRSIKVNHARSLIAAHFYGVSRSVCDIIALAHETDGRIELIFQEFRPDKKKKPEVNKREMQRWMSVMKGFSHPLGDYMTLLKAYRMYLKVAAKLPVDETVPNTDVDILGNDTTDIMEMSSPDEINPNQEEIKQPPSVRKWCKEHYINANRMARVRFMSKQLYYTLQNIVRPVQHKEPKRQSKLEKQNALLEEDIDATLSEFEPLTRESLKDSKISKIPDSNPDSHFLKSDIELPKSPESPESHTEQEQEGGFMQRIRAQEAIDRLGANIKRFPTEDENIMMALGIGNYVNFAIRSKQADNVYVSCFAQTKKFSKINQESFLVAHTKSKLPNIIMYDEMFQSSNEARFMKLNLVNKIPDSVFSRIKEEYGAFIKYCL